MMENGNNEDNFAERRRAPRVQGAVVEYSQQEDAVTKKKAFLKDISVLGVGLHVSERLEPKTILYLDIYMFGTKTPVKVKAKVVWRKQGEYLGYYEVGIEYVDVSEDEKARLSDYITHAREEEHPEEHSE